MGARPGRRPSGGRRTLWEGTLFPTRPVWTLSAAARDPARLRHGLLALLRAAVRICGAVQAGRAVEALHGGGVAVADGPRGQAVARARGAGAAQAAAVIGVGIAVGSVAVEHEQV